MYNTNSQIKFKNLILKSSLSDYSDAYILLSGAIGIDGAGDDDYTKWSDEREKKYYWKIVSYLLIT